MYGSNHIYPISEYHFTPFDQNAHFFAFRQSPGAESFNRKRKADWFAGLSIDTCHVCGYSYTTHGNQFPPQSLFQSCAHTQNGSQADKRIIFKKKR